jgi:hypothetical protein
MTSTSPLACHLVILSVVKHLPLIIVIVAFTGLATLYSAVVPLGEGPDEPGHAGYVFFVAREGRLPVQRADPAASDVPGEGHQPPLAYALAAPLVAWLPPEERRLDLPGNPRFTWSGGTEPNAAAHGSRELWPWRGAVLGWHLARLASVACGAATVVFTYLAARALSDQRPKTKDQTDLPLVLGPSSLVPLVAAALVAFNPQFLFTSALVTNDALLAALSAAMLWLVVRRATSNERRAASDERRAMSNERRAASDERRAASYDERLKTKDQRRVTNQQPHKASSVLGRLVIWSFGLRSWVVGPWSAEQRHTLGHAIALGFVLGLALIAKQSALLLAPVALLSVLEQGWWAKGGRKTQKRNVALSPGHLVILSHVLVFVGVTLAVSGWWYARNWRLYGDPFGLAAFQAEFATQAFDVARLDAWVAALKQLHSSFWARFGWMNLRPPGWAIWFFTAVEAVALVGWLRTGVRDQTTKRPSDQKTKRPKDQATENLGGISWLVLGPWSLVFGPWSSGSWALPALPILAFAWVVSFALTAGLVAWQGRLLFPALPAIAILLALGLSSVVSGSRQSAVGSWQFLATARYCLLPTACCVLALWLPFGVIRPAYPFQVVSERQALAQLGTPVYARLGKPGDPGAELCGWQLEGELRPGATAELKLTWQARGRQNRDWTVFVHMVDAGEKIIAEDNRQPRDGAFPMTQWVAGDWVQDRHPLVLPAGLSPGSYSLRVGLWDPATGERAAVYDQKGKLIGDYLEIGEMTIRG